MALGLKKIGRPALITRLSPAPPMGGGVPQFTAAGLPKWTAAVRAQKAGTRNARLLVIGMSTEAGAGSNGSLVGNGRANSWPTQLANSLPGGSVQSIFCDAGVRGIGSSLPSYDPRVTLGTNVGASFSSLGGTSFSISGPGTYDLAIPTPCDTFEICYNTYPGLGTLTTAFDSGAVVDSVSTSTGSAGFAKRTVTTALGVHTIHLGQTGAQVIVDSIVAYNSASKEISVLNAGWCSAKVPDWTATTYPSSPLNAIASYSADLVIICININDWNAGTDRATYRAGLSSLVDAAVAGGGDVLLMTGPPSNPAQGGSSYAVQQTYIDDNNTVIASKGLQPLINAWADVFGGIWQSSKMFDNLHENGLGAGQVAALTKGRIGF